MGEVRGVLIERTVDVGLRLDQVVTDWGLALGMGRGREPLRRAVELLLDCHDDVRQAEMLEACVENVKRARVEPPVVIVMGRGVTPSRAAGAFRLTPPQRAVLVSLWFAAAAHTADELRGHCDQALANLALAIEESRRVMPALWAGKTEDWL